ncbi:uncharacterized protein QC761_0022720 [Podospora bellae-mahoneyi]|uniref:Uncharacterized protein n=1 Tax=Podospora bellae-mahoneyi TaxID=2093777 RepID=A0ABR0G1M8_9PEZI|nr:hypothetical protein QC761_0022720 [Podospora bellae-mahoneyi]
MALGGGVAPHGCSQPRMTATEDRTPGQLLQLMPLRNYCKRTADPGVDNLKGANRRLASLSLPCGLVVRLSTGTGSEGLGYYVNLVGT